MRRITVYLEPAQFAALCELQAAVVRLTGRSVSRSALVQLSIAALVAQDVEDVAAAV